MQIRWKVSKKKIFGVSCVCLLGWLLLSIFDRTMETVQIHPIRSDRMNPCKINGFNQTPAEERWSRKCVRRIEPTMLVAFCRTGRLGNQMLQYATLFALGRHNNRKALMSHKMSDILSKSFKVSLGTLDENIYIQTEWTNRRVGGVVDDSITTLTETHVRLYGMPQSWKYFDKIRPLIRKEFQFHDEIVQIGKTKLRSIRDEFFPNDHVSVTMVGVHVRRGDYVQIAQDMGFYLPGMLFYSGAMSYFEGRYKNVIFLVASDDIQWCLENFVKFRDKFRIHFLQFNASDDMVVLDLTTLTHCHHVIYGIGSFGFWAGYLNPGQVIFCSDCMTSTAEWLRRRETYNGDYGNVVLPSWIGYSRNGTKTDRSALARTKDLIGPIGPIAPRGVTGEDE